MYFRRIDAGIAGVYLTGNRVVDVLGFDIGLEFVGDPFDGCVEFTGLAGPGSWNTIAFMSVQFSIDGLRTGTHNLSLTFDVNRIAR